MASTHMISSPSRRTSLLRRGAAVLALAAILGTHLAAPGAALAGGCGYCDDDGDGITNSEELSYGTDLYNADTDFDGASDLDEIIYLYTNPLVPDQGSVGGGIQNDPAYDYDGDGLGAYDEQTYGTSVELADTDGDSYGDGYELSMGYDPLNAFSVPPAPNGKG